MENNVDTRKISGLIAINKKTGISSNQCLNIFKRQTNIKKCGFAGTLDPFASGILVIACNKATKQIESIVSHKKTYLFKVKFGTETDTGDIEGKIIHTSNHFPSAEDIKAELRTNFIGKIQQMPPIFSALKHNGKRLCDLARQGMPYEQLKEIAKEKQREIEIEKIDAFDYNKEDQTILIRAITGKGTYIRQLAVNLGQNLGSYAHVIELTREAVGEFTLKNSIDIDKINKEKMLDNVIIC